MTTKPFNKEQTLTMAIEVVKKFGFISRSTVWNYLTPPGRASKFRYWSYLCESHELKFARSSRRLPNYLVLSRDYRKAFPDDCGVKNRSTMYFPHDELLMNFALEGVNSAFISEFWSEHEFKMDTALCSQILGSSNGEKLPDVVFDLKARDHVRVALEIERTRKSHSRYRRIRVSYAKLKNIHLVIFGVPDRRTESIIAETCESPNFSLGFFTLRDYESNGLKCEIRIRNKTFSMNEFFAKLCSTNKASLRQQGDKPEIGGSGLSQVPGGLK